MKQEAFLKAHRPVLPLFFLFFSMAIAAVSGCADRRSVAFLGLETESCSPQEGRFIESILQASLSTRRPVVAPLSVRQKLGEGCSAAACNAETAKALGASDVVSGRLKKDGAWTLRVERYRASDGQTFEKRWQADSVEQLARRVEKEGGDLLKER